MIRSVLILSIVLFIISCAQVPKESVELSATVGRDMVEMEKAHIAIVNIYYDRLFNDINEFVDNVYMPFQIQQTLGDATLREEIMSAIEAAGKPDPTGEKQKSVIEILGIFLEEIQREVESYRRTKLMPVEQQQATLLANIEESYDRIHYANSIVTGHLASVVKVHDTQNEILAKVDLEDMRSEIGLKTVDISDDITQLTAKAKQKSVKLDKLINKFDALMEKYNN
jgi:hypothetical protein